MLVFPRLVSQGALPNADFVHLYGPTSLDILALWYRIFGYTLEIQRTFGLLQHLGIIFAIYSLARAWGYLAAVGSALVATALIISPIGLSALAWHGGLAFALWAVVLGVRARQTDSLTCWWWAGGLAGLALGYRPDLGVAVLMSIGFLVWRQRGATLMTLGGAVVALLPMWVHIARIGPLAAIQGMLVDPVVHLRPGRELPIPPSWGIVDGALQAVAEGSPPWWRLPAPPASQQLFVWFFGVVLIAVAIPVTTSIVRRRGTKPVAQTTTLMAASLLGLGILPQAMQRPDSTHLAWVAVVSWPLLVPALIMFMGHKSRLSTRALVATGAVGIAMLAVIPFFTFRAYVLHSRVSVGNLPAPFEVERDGRRFYFGDPNVARALNQMIPDLDALSAPGDRLIVGPADLSRTIYSDVAIYFLFPELVPATRFIEMDPGLADKAGSGLAEEIPSADFLVLTNIWTGWNEPNASNEHRSQEHNLAVAKNFCLIARYEDNLILLFRRCPNGGVNPAEVDGKYPVGDAAAP